MADENTTTTPAKPKTVREHFPSRSLFASAELAAAFLNDQASKLSDFEKQRFAMVGVDAEGNFNPDIYKPDQTRVMVAKLLNRGDKDSSGKRGPSTVKAVVVGAVPTLAALLADQAGTDWVQSIIDKELNHVLVRPLREAENIDSAIAEMPSTREAFITSQRSGGDLESFDELYKAINTTMSSKSKPWDKARLIKSEMRKAMESAAYAQEYYPQLEDRGEKDSLFVTAIKIGQLAAKQTGLAPDIFDRWLATRDAQELTVDDEEDFDIEALAGSIKLDSDEAETGDDPTPADGEAEQPAA